METSVGDDAQSFLVLFVMDESGDSTQLREGNESQAETRILQPRQHLLLGQSFFLEQRNESLGKSGDLLYHEKNMDTTFIRLLCH